MELVERLNYFQCWRREVYSRGFLHGFIACAVGVAFFVFYLWAGGAQ